MITGCYAISRKMAESLRDHKPSELARRLDQLDRVWLVSVTEPDYPPVHAHATPWILPLQFHDWAPEFGTPEPRLPFTAHAAARVADFVRRAHADPAAGALVANCEMGMSRSAAIARWAAETCGVATSALVMNAQARPNPLVLKRLRAA